MTGLDAAMILICVLLLAYLTYALLRAERF